MEKFLDIVRNQWVKFAFSLLTPAFPAFMVMVDWLAFAYYFHPKNDIPLFLLYVLVNFVFTGLLFYTRKQLMTCIVVCITPLIALVLLIIAFGQWYLIIPPVAACAIAFLAAGLNETFKTILGTIYLLLFVVGTLVYLTMLHFNLTLQTLVSLTECDVSKRSDNYSYSPDGKYRLVEYIDYAGNERNLTTFYVEETENDVSLPYLDCYRHLGSQKVLVTMHQDEVTYKWINNTELYIDGRPKDIEEIFRQAKEKENQPEQEDETDKEKLTYYEAHDFGADEYYGTQTQPVIETLPPTEDASETPDAM